MNAAFNQIKDETELFAGDVLRADGSYLDAVRYSGRAYKVISSMPEAAISKATSGIRFLYRGAPYYHGTATKGFLPHIRNRDSEHLSDRKRACKYGIFLDHNLNRHVEVRTWADMFSGEYSSRVQNFEEELRQHVIAPDGLGIVYYGGAEPPDAFDTSPCFTVDTSSYIADLKKQDLFKLIKNARAAISGLEEDWDGEGAEALEPATFEAASSFLKNYFEHLLDGLRSEIELPEINACRNGSIDLEWHAKDAQLLINIRRKGDEYHAYYYGDRYNNRMPIKGSLPVGEFSDFLAVWMKYLA